MTLSARTLGLPVPKIKIKGASALSADFNALERAERAPTLRKAVRAGALVARNSIRDRVPVRTGLLKKNIVVGTQRSSTPSGSQTAVVRLKNGASRYAHTKANVRKGRAGKAYETEGPAYYGRFVELGTKDQPAQPYMRPGFDAVEEAIAAEVETVIAEQIDRILGAK